jgi:BioD-like phosphotransacetylase family protein
MDTHSKRIEPRSSICAVVEVARLSVASAISEIGKNTITTVSAAETALSWLTSRPLPA